MEITQEQPQQKDRATQHNLHKAVIFQRKIGCLGWDSNPQHSHSRQHSYTNGTCYMYKWPFLYLRVCSHVDEVTPVVEGLSRWVQWGGSPGEVGSGPCTCPGDGSRESPEEESDREKTEGERYVTLIIHDRDDCIFKDKAIHKAHDTNLKQHDKSLSKKLLSKKH